MENPSTGDKSVIAMREKRVGVMLLTPSCCCLTCYVNARRTNYLSTTLESSTNENDFNYHLQHLSPCFVMPGALAVGFVLGRRLQLGRRFLSRGYKLQFHTSGEFSLRLESFRLAL